LVRSEAGGLGVCGCVCVGGWVCGGVGGGGGGRGSIHP